MLWSTFCTVQRQLIKHREYLATCESAAIKGDNPELKAVMRSLSTIKVTFVPILGFLEVLRPTPSEILDLRSTTDRYLYEIPYRIRLNFLTESTGLQSPYRWEETCSTIQISDPIPASLKTFVEESISNAIKAQDLRPNAADSPKPEWIIQSMRELVSFWRPSETDCVPDGIILLLNLLNRGDSAQVFGNIVRGSDVEIRLWECFSRTVLAEPQEDSFVALWSLASKVDYLPSNPFLLHDSSGACLAALESVLKAVSIAASLFSPINCSVIALVKVRIVYDIHLGLTIGVPWPMARDYLCWLNHHLLPAETASQIADGFHSVEGELSKSQHETISNFMNRRLMEACLVVVAEFLEHCTSDVLPYKAAETFCSISTGIFLLPRVLMVHPTHQMRLANSIHTVSQEGQYPELLDEIINSQLWQLYAEGLKSEEEIEEYNKKLDLTATTDEHCPWLDNHQARRKIHDAFAGYEKKLRSTAGSSREVLPRLQRILQGFDCWHLEIVDLGTANAQSISRVDDKQVGAQIDER
ncbi:hypothetical protein B0H19DRAFT_1266926 [Mycena capillaripes]|nr:hypothetical protein B0H19DRAFT_1266926 [Mycena capillaripes]